MRLRNIKGAKDFIEKDKSVIALPKEYKGKWKKLFKNNNPIHLEIGMGKGGFIQGMAEKYPDINFIGLEKYPSVLYKAVKKNIHFPNLFIINENADNILDIFAENEIDLIYLNFSDPWQKTKYRKRRLTNSGYLDKYKVVLKNDSYLYFKTDNEGLFTYSLGSMKKYGLIISNVCYDLHKTNFDNVLTEYETKFGAFGPIYRLEAQFAINK